MPRRKSSFVEDLILCPWWVSVVLAVTAWIAFRIVLPTIHFSNPFLLALSPVATQFAPFVTLALLATAAFSALRAWQNRRALDAQTGIESLRALPSKRFEDILAEAYRRKGYAVEEMLGGGADGGVDLTLRKGGELVVVQCKRWRGNRPVPVETVRELFDVMVDRRATAAKLVATTHFTRDATAFAAGKPIELVDAEALLHLIRDVQASPRVTIPTSETAPLSPACPECGGTMVQRLARKGRNAGNKFWGCSAYPR